VGTGRSRGVDIAAAWVAGLAAGAAVLGPGLGPGSLLSLDLVLTQRIPVPPGVWGLGPPLPQRVPLSVPLAWLSSLAGGPAVGKALVVVAVAAAFAGAVRLAVGAPLAARVGAGLLYAAGPFAVTRVAAGHLNVLVALAVLPWALPSLLAPSARVRATFAWCVALAVAGPAGGAVALPAVLVGLVAERGRRAPAVVAVAVVAQVPWLLPAVAVLAGGAEVSGAGEFATRAGGPLGPLGVVAGDGFWRAGSQVGGGGALVAVGAVLVALAVAGWRSLPEPWGRRGAVLAAVAAVVALSSGLPGVRGPYRWLTGTAIGAPFRDSHRALVLTLAWLCPAAAFGAGRLAAGLRAARPAVAEAAAALPLAVALVAVVPCLWGAGGRLEPVDLPAGWAAVRSVVDDQPGTVLALPWHEYLVLGFAEDRTVLDPLPDYLAVDVLSSYDPGFGPPRQEQVDPRAAGMEEVVERLRRGGAVAGDLLARGVRWVVLLHEADWPAYRGLADDPGLTTRLRTASVDLYAVDGWPGGLVTGDPVISPLWLVDGPDGARWAHPYAPGWLRGWSSATKAPGGLVDLPAGTGPVWYWPAVPVAGGSAVVVGAGLAAGWSARRRGRMVDIDHDTELPCGNQQVRKGFR
jgi:hypothetical protein